MEKLLCSIDDAVESLGVSRPTIYRLIRQGELVHVNVGRRGFVTVGSVHKFVDRLTAAKQGGAK
ncbi:hypothetical protein GCM10009645_15650 [Mycolicibacterium poriferae]|jgi:excisionase family DNA binding protein|uniref:Helix-turn-helix domain-containing protein n=1 Tax=Mycolicibacterium poriferae TaxID=39694 RepID=A0A6N4VBL1_9MYCO|nr:helix-turn-helix domain-containing protein [Mycolicibacterium poriferae]MCV7261650.1 helix-turn-helix domain-containing protein [Mycolicibacterium poriferae]BBX52215.1 hypothetical protein MPOR_32410 [Mycolicibacterium poriferae]